MQSGIVYAVLAFVWWGLFPLYFKIVASVTATEVLVHRVVWSVLFIAVLLALRGQWAWLPRVLRHPRVLGVFAISATLLSVNWLTYIWAVTNGHVVDASLGYFITPLVNVLLGYTLLHERPQRAQWVALSLAALGVVWLTVQAGRLPWIALMLAVTFGCYGLMRKVATLGPLEGLALETVLLTPFALLALVIWWRQGVGSFPAPDVLTNAWLIALGPLTAIPLLLFAAGARRMPLTTLGLVQYLSPTLQFAIGVWAFEEPFSAARLAGFGCIWLALAIYSLDGWWRTTRPAAAIA